MFCIPGSVGVRKKTCYVPDSFSCQTWLKSDQTFPAAYQAGSQGCKCSPPPCPQTSKPLLPRLVSKKDVFCCCFTACEPWLQPCGSAAVSCGQEQGWMPGWEGPCSAPSRSGAQENPGITSEEVPPQKQDQLQPCLAGAVLVIIIKSCFHLNF